MATPTLQAEGTTVANTSGSLTVTLPSHQANDILVLCLGFWGPNTAGSAADIPTPSGWTQFGGMNVPASGNADGKMQWFWKRATSSSETNPVCARGASWDTGTDTCFGGRAYTIRNCKTSGTPWADAQVAGPYTAANGALPAITVTGDHSTVIQFLISLDNQTPGTISGWTAGTDDNDATGTDCDFQTYSKSDISANTGADASTVAIPAQGAYGFGAVSFQAQTIDISAAGAIASSEAIGSAKLNLNMSGAGGIASAEAFGSPTLTQSGPQTISNAGGIASAEAFGSPQINLKLSPSGIAGSEAFGTAQLNLKIAPSGIGSAEAMGAATISLNIASAGGIASGEGFGSPQFNLTVAPAGIASSEAVGSPTISEGPLTQTISPEGIASAETFGTPTIHGGAVTSPGPGAGMWIGANLVPTPVPVPAPQLIEARGIASEEAFGNTFVLKLTPDRQPEPEPVAQAEPEPEPAIETPEALIARLFPAPLVITNRDFEPEQPIIDLGPDRRRRTRIEEEELATLLAFIE